MYKILLGVPTGDTAWKTVSIYPRGSITIPTGNHSRSFALVIVCISNGSSNYYCGRFSLLASEANNDIIVVDIATWNHNYEASRITFTKVSDLFTVNNAYAEWGYAKYIAF